MQNLFNFILRYHFVLLFLALEITSITLIVSTNQDKERVLLSSANDVSGYFYSHFNFITEYLSLVEMNEALSKENAQYRNSFVSAYKSNIVLKQEIIDKEYEQQYYYISARVINNSINRLHNYITLDKGKKAGIEIGMAVVTGDGIVGVVRDVSENYASVISLLNTKLGVSVKLKKNGYFGSASWSGTDYSSLSVKEIPNHVPIIIGDTIITSGYSTIFPEGILVGTINKFDQEQGSNFYNISIKLSANFKTLSYVYVIGDLLKTERNELETVEE